MIKKTLLNDIEIVKDWGELKPKPVLPNQKKIAGEIAYFNMLVAASKGSGKTVSVINAIKKILTNKTILVVFSSTFNKGEDKDAFNDFEERVNGDKSKLAGRLEVYESIYGKNGDILLQLIEDARDRYEIIKDKDYPNSFPNYIFMFDDLPEDNFKSETLDLLFKTNRHIGACCFMITHRWNQITPLIRDNIDIIILFAGQTIDNLDCIFRWINLVMTKKEFMKKYNYATKDKHNFLYINLKDRQLRKNFNIGLDIEDDNENTKNVYK
jgi:hypothetical protein